MTSEDLADSFGYMTRDEVTFLKSLARGLPDDPLAVNVGAGVGTSGLALLEARDDLILVTLDTFRGMRPEGGLENERGVLKRNGISPDRYLQIKDDSGGVFRRWPIKGLKEFVDLVFVDGNHFYDNVKLDVESWFPLLVVNGVFALHDCDARKGKDVVWPDVQKIVDKYFSNIHELVDHVDTLIAFRKSFD